MSTDKRVNDLIKIALNVPENKKPKRQDNDVDIFIQTFNIKSGDTEVPASIIYYTYMKWREKPIGKQTFFRQFAKVFDKKKGSGGRIFYFLDPEPFDLSEENLWRAKSHVRKRYEKKENKQKVKEKEDQT